MSMRSTYLSGHVDGMQFYRHVQAGAMFDPNRPYNELPPLPPTADVETRAILKKWGLARTALAEMRLAGPLIPDPAVLISSIPLLEAKDSSEIENIVTTNDALFRQASLGDAEGDPAAKEALRYRTALYYGLDALKDLPLSTRIAVEVCQLVTGVQLGVRAIPVNLKNRHTGEVIYTPPKEQHRLRELLSNWERYLHEQADNLDPLIRMTILHYQFEAIHPFEDGNGRTGRILNILRVSSRMAYSIFPRCTSVDTFCGLGVTTIDCSVELRPIRNGNLGFSTCSPPSKRHRTGRRRRSKQSAP